MLEAIQSLYDKGGPVVAILLVLSVIGLAAALYKGWAFYRMGLGRHGPAYRALNVWQRYPSAEALDLLEQARGPVAVSLLHAMRGQLYNADQGALVREDIDRVASAEIAAARRGIRVLEVIGQVAPLLGLFGTVLGMIDAFQAMEGAGANVDPSVLAAGIWVALLTTAVGLAIAIPASMLATWFETLVDRETEILEGMVTSVLTGELTAAGQAAPRNDLPRAVAGTHARS
ncbi:MotA/TolQ/ExbB proton channel family protein [Sneathiella chinensis]|uniref:Flagellar motor protein MotA n=1 Tax=Sneathiella chinensis TaxID=349750 RepID=A0ABQ5U569_9PROT|nr:MotA/TolQ/ExbB proton channel family protein [Sneathiella chinensis]GLQ06868.1 flagellar motor protein MotA [Sneathiella chinensis]